MLALLGRDGPRLVEASEPVVRAEDLGLLRGESVFETLRLVSGVPVDVDRHIDRLAQSAQAVDVDLPAPDELEALAARVVDAWPERDGVLRLVATKGGEGVDPVRFALVSPMPAGLDELRTNGIAVVTLGLGIAADARSRAPWLLGGAKSTSYAVAMAAQRAAATQSAVDALWVSSDGTVLEGATSTVLVARGAALLTPPAAELGLLPGLTLWRLRRLVPIVERRISTAELAAADEVLLASSVRGVVPVSSLDGRALAIGPFGARLPAALERDLRANPR